MAEGLLSNDPSHPYALEADPKVKARNRYINVQAWANCRIHLRVPEGECDFINASPITLRDTITQEERKYIATQVGDSTFRMVDAIMTFAKRISGP
jgi:protein-tyrosine phosphatase